MKIINIYEITPNGESLTLKSRKKVLSAFFEKTDNKIVFNSGTDYTRPERLLAEIKRRDYLLLVENGKDNVILMKWNREIKRDFKRNKEKTTYELLVELIA